MTDSPIALRSAKEPGVRQHAEILGPVHIRSAITGKEAPKRQVSHILHGRQSQQRLRTTQERIQLSGGRFYISLQESTVPHGLHFYNANWAVGLFGQSVIVKLFKEHPALAKSSISEPGKAKGTGREPGPFLKG